MVDRKYAVGTEGPAGVGVGGQAVLETFGRPIGGDIKMVGVVGVDGLKSSLEALRGTGIVENCNASEFYTN